MDSSFEHFRFDQIGNDADVNDVDEAKRIPVESFVAIVGRILLDQAQIHVELKAENENGSLNQQKIIKDPIKSQVITMDLERFEKITKDHNGS